MKTFQKFVRKYAIWIIILIAVLPFFSTLGNSFISDDWEFLDHAATKPYTIEWLFETNTNGHTMGGSYRPIVNVYWGTMYQIFQTNPLPYHISILLCFAVSIFLLYKIIQKFDILRKQKDAVALVAAALFALFPSRVAALSWIAVINDTLLVTLLLGSWLCYICFFQKKKWWYLLASTILFALALGTKEVAVTFPIVIVGSYILLSYTQKMQKSWWQHVRAIALHTTPYVLALAGFFALRYQIIGLLSQDYTGASFSFWNNDTRRSYISLTLAPLLIDPLRTLVTKQVYTHLPWLAVIALYATSFFAYMSTKKQKIIVSILVVWYLAALFPTARFGVNFWSITASTEGERYAYYPSIFLAILLALCIVYLWGKMHRYGKMLLICVGFGVFCYWQIGTLQKITRWNLASEWSEQLYTELVIDIQSHEYDGIILFGVPDNLHGAFMWRNALKLKLVQETKLEDADIIISPLRSVPTVDQLFEVQGSSRAIMYSSKKPLLVGLPHITTGEYDITHASTTYREPLSISYTDFTRAVRIVPTKEFIQKNSEKTIALFFYDGKSGWKRLILSDVYTDTSMLQ